MATLTVEQKKAKSYLNNSSVVSKEKFTWIYTIKTQQVTSVRRFREAVKALGGWVEGNGISKTYTIEGYRNAGNQSFYELSAAVPAAV